MKNKRAALPNLFTLTNVFLGFLAIIKISEGNFTTAAWFILFATICDQIDGRLARWSKTYSQFGKQLDSIADAISFGIAPAFLVYETNFSTADRWGAVFCFIFILAGIFRLARFNVETKGYKRKYYKGLPIPVAAMALASFFIMAQHFWDTVEMVRVMMILVPALSLLMVSTITFEKIPSLMLHRSLRKSIKPLTYIAGFTCIIINPRIWLFPWTMVYIVVAIIEGLVVKLREEDEEAEMTLDEE